MKILIACGTRGNDLYFKLVEFMAEQVRRYNAELVFGECSWSAERSQELVIGKIYERQFDWVLFVDSDVAPPMDALEKLLATGKPIVVAPVWMAHKHDVHINVHYIDDPRRVYVRKESGVEEVAHASFACLLVAHEVFAAFRAAGETLLTWSKLVSPQPTGNVPDGFFSHKARALGFKIHICWDVKGTIHHRPVRLSDRMMDHIVENVK